MLNLKPSRDSDETISSSRSQYKEFTGFLLFRKKQAFARTWKQRYIVFRAPYLWIYSSPNDKTFLYQYDLSSYDTITNDPTNKKSSFGIVLYASRLSLQPTTSHLYPIIHLCAYEPKVYNIFMEAVLDFLNAKKEDRINQITGRVAVLSSTPPNHLLKDPDEVQSFNENTNEESIFYSQKNQSAFDFKPLNVKFNTFGQKSTYNRRKNSVQL